MSRRPFVLRGLCLAFACVAGLWLGVDSSPEEAESTSRQRSAAADVSDQAGVPVPYSARPSEEPDRFKPMRAVLPEPTPRASWLPLPPEDLPVKASFAVLKARADQGDASAACRLAGELLRCRQVQSLAWSQGLPKTVLAATQQHCQGLAEPEMQWMTELLRQAALAGNRAAIEDYVGGVAFEFEPRQALAHLSAYQAEAPALAAAALRAGSIRALHEFEVAYDYGASSTWLGRAIGTEHDPDLVLDLQLLRALVTGADGRGEGSLALRRTAAQQTFQKLMGSDYAEREQLALKRLNDWFAGQPQRFSFGGLALVGGGGPSSALNDACTKVLIEQPLTPPPPDWLRPVQSGGASRK